VLHVVRARIFKCFKGDDNRRVVRVLDRGVLSFISSTFTQLDICNRFNPKRTQYRNQTNMYVTQNCEFDWDPATRGRILGSFLYGYILTSMAGGFMANSYGVKIPFVCAGVGNAVFHLLCPTAVLVHTELLFACRLLQGMSAVNTRAYIHIYIYIERRTRPVSGIGTRTSFRGGTGFLFSQGLTVGPVFQLFSAWTSDEEVSTLLSFGLSGFSFGSIIAYPLSGYLCTANYNGFGGWALIYYVPGKKTLPSIAHRVNTRVRRSAGQVTRRLHATTDVWCIFFFRTLVRHLNENNIANTDFSDRVRSVRRVLVSISVQRTGRSSEYIARRIHLLVGKRRHIRRSIINTASCTKPCRNASDPRARRVLLFVFVARGNTVEVHIHVVTVRRLHGVLLVVFMERVHLHGPRAGAHAGRVGRLVERGDRRTVIVKRRLYRPSNARHAVSRYVSYRTDICFAYR